MKYSHHNLGRLFKGQQVEVSLAGNAANVFLLNDVNYKRYSSAQKYSGFGGLAKQSPLTMTIPNNDLWHIVVDFGGYVGKVDSKVIVHPANKKTA